MTLRALLAERAFMRFGFLMAGDALAGRLPELLVRFMAASARDRFVRAFQIEIGEPVAERFFVELHHIGVAAFVVGMAMLAFGVDRIGTPPMQTVFLLSVGCDILVAGHTELGL